MSGAEEHECPTCSRKFSSKRGVKVHHAKIHGESIAGVEVACDHCGETKIVVPDRVERYDKHYCDNVCSGADRGNCKTVECHWCGDDNEISKYRVENFERNFCDDNCKGAWQSTRTGEDAPAYKPNKQHTAECANCGGEVGHRTPTRIERADRNFCAPNCFEEWQKTDAHPSGPDHPNYKGYEYYYGPSWDERRERALEVYSRCCALCGKHENEHYRSLDVHHIRPFRKFQKDDGSYDFESANAVENLVPLCNSCHKKWEGVPVRPDPTPSSGD